MCDSDGVWWHVALLSLAAVVAAWLALVVALLVAKPDVGRLRESLRLLPDVVRLLSRLARDREVPMAVRVQLWLLLGYLAMPFDIVPDFIPVLGYADDAIIVAAALRSSARRAGRDALERNWPGTPEGLTAVARLAGIN
jgi:uncharacterized membrane protein YkvA (DUF1232 family)